MKYNTFLYLGFDKYKEFCYENIKCVHNSKEANSNEMCSNSKSIPLLLLHVLIDWQYFN